MNRIPLPPAVAASEGVGPARRRFLAQSAAGIAALLATRARAQDYPQRALRFILPYPPGTGADMAMRVVAEVLAQRVGQTVLVENKPGASGILAMQEFKRAPADGHTFVLGDVGTMAINPLIFRKLPYDPAKDFAIVTDLIRLPWAFFVPKSSGIKTFAEFAAAARARPGELTSGTAGSGAPNAMVMGLLKLRTGLVLRDIPHGAGSGIGISVASGRVDIFASPLASAEPYRGRLTALAIASAERDHTAPEIPTLAEVTGIKDFEIQAWTMVLARAETPPLLVQRMRDELVKILAMPAIRERLQTAGMQPGGSPDTQALQRLLARDAQAFAEVVRAEKIEKQ